jgi:phage terminase small subunit
MSSPEVTIEPPSRKPFPKRAKQGEIASIEMTKSCARDLTDRIKAAVDDVSELLWRAHEGRAWHALGYESWKQYCETEFQISKPRSYQLLDFVEIKREIKESTKVDSPQNESQTRALKSVPTEKRAEAWKRAVEIADGGQPSAKQVEQAAAEVYPQEKSPEDRIRDSVMRSMREEINQGISFALTREWERAKRVHLDAQWTHFLSGVQSWLNRSELGKRGAAMSAPENANPPEPNRANQI